MEISALLAGAVLIGLFARRVGLPFTVVLALVGFLAGWLGRPLGLESPVEGEEFEEVLVFVFLPVLVFAAALGISTRAFLNNLGAILVLAVPALILSSVFVGLALYFGLGVPFAAALLLVALGTGEVTFLGGVLDFFRVFAGGVAIWVGVGLVVALALPWLDRLAAGALSLAGAYGGFVLADYVLGYPGLWQRWPPVWCWGDCLQAGRRLRCASCGSNCGTRLIMSPTRYCSCSSASP